MRRLVITHKVIHEQGEVNITDRVIGVTLTNLKSTKVTYSWQDDARNLELDQGESVSFGFQDGFVLGGNRLYYGFASGGSSATQSLQITQFVIGESIGEMSDPQDC